MSCPAGANKGNYDLGGGGAGLDWGILTAYLFKHSVKTKLFAIDLWLYPRPLTVAAVTVFDVPDKNEFTLTYLLTFLCYCS